MKNRNCPNKDACWDYDASNCKGCSIGQKIEKFARKIKRLQAENAELRHRAEVAERALRAITEQLPCSYCAFRLNCRYEGATCLENCLRQAEKELAEEKKK